MQKTLCKYRDARLAKDKVNKCFVNGEETKFERQY